MANDQYPEKFCAFIDILAFRQLVARLSSDRRSVAALRDILLQVHNPVVQGVIDPNALDYWTQSISDAVAISVVPTPLGLLTVFNALSALSLDLLDQGYFIRGAIVRGRLFHDDLFVFGDALIRAYDLETKVVRYPRIMVTSDVITQLPDGDSLTPTCRQAVRMADDGPFYLHVLNRMEKEINDAALGPDQEPAKFQRYYNIRTLIQERFLEAVDTPAHFEKVQWFARYWNSSLSARASSLRINAPGV